MFTTMISLPNFGGKTQEYYILVQFNGSDPLCTFAKRRKKHFTKTSDFISTLFSQKTAVNSQNFTSDVVHDEYMSTSWVHDFSPTITTLKSTFPHTFIRSHLHSYLAEYGTVCLISIIEVVLEQTRVISHPQSIFLHSLISLFNKIFH